MPVQFEEDNLNIGFRTRNADNLLKSKSKMVAWVIKTGITTDEGVAEKILLGIAIVFFIGTFVLAYGVLGPGFGNTNTKPATNLSIEEIRQKRIETIRNNVNLTEEQKQARIDRILNTQ